MIMKVKKRNFFNNRNCFNIGIYEYKDYDIYKIGLFNYVIFKDKKMVGYSISKNSCKNLIDKNKRVGNSNLPIYFIKS